MKKTILITGGSGLVGNGVKSIEMNYDYNFIYLSSKDCNLENYNLENSHVIPALIHKCYLAKQESIPFIIAGSGKPLRQFIYSEDLAKLILWILENYNDKESIIRSE